MGRDRRRTSVISIAHLADTLSIMRLRTVDLGTWQGPLDRKWDQLDLRPLSQLQQASLAQGLLPRWPQPQLVRDRRLVHSVSGVRRYPVI